MQYLNIFATDKGNPPLQTVDIVEIVAVGSLSFSPLVKFDKVKYEIKVLEHAVKGVAIGQVNAISQTGPVQYKISGGNDIGVFGIEQKTGIIKQLVYGRELFLS